MFKSLFALSLFATLAVNLIFLFATKDKPPDASQAEPARRMFLASNEFHDYSGSAPAAAPDRPQVGSAGRANDARDKRGGGVEGARATHDDNNNEIPASATSAPGAEPAAPASLAAGQSRDNESTRARPADAIGPGSDWSRAGRRRRSESRRPLEGPQRAAAGPDYLASQRAGANGVGAGPHQGGAQISPSRDPEPAPEVGGPHAAPQANGSNQMIESSGPRLAIRVKSSKNHVFISIDGQLIYESKQIGGSSLHHHHPRHPTIWPLQAAPGPDRQRARIRVRPQHDKLAEQRARPAPSGHPRGADMIEFEVEQAESRGLHVIVLSQFDGSLMSRRIFDTYSAGQDHELCMYLQQITDGRLLVFAVKDEASFRMSSGSPARRLLQQLGSRRIGELRWRDMWALIVRKSTPAETGGRIGDQLPANKWHQLANSRLMNLAEGLSRATADQANAFGASWADPVIIEAQVELLATHQAEHQDPGRPMSQSTSSESDQVAPAGRACEWANINYSDTINDHAGAAQPGNSNELHRRARFCARVEGYGRACDCHYPAPITFKPAQIERSQLDQVPIVVIASNRPYYLYRMLRSLLAADGVNSSMVLVSIDGFYEEPLQVSKLFNLRAIQQRPAGRRSSRISHHYKSSLTATFELFPEAEFAIIFEEDLDVARDALVYFNQTIGLLRQDATLYCSSAWNDQGYEHSVQPIKQQLASGSAATDPEHLVYRIETMPGMGWMLSRRLFKQELEPHWPPTEQPHDWDMWIRTEPIRKGRECLIPDTSRTFHFGSSGTNVNSYFQKQYFSRHAFSGTKTLAELRPGPLQGNSTPEAPQRAVTQFTKMDDLQQAAYEQLIESLIARGNVIGGSVSSGNQREPHSSGEQLHGNSTTKVKLDANHEDAKLLCQLANITANLSSLDQHVQSNSARTNVIFIKMIDGSDVKNWLKLAKCWRLWDLDARGQHKSMWRLFLANRMTLVVGHPASPYSRFKPPDLVPYDL